MASARLSKLIAPAPSNTKLLDDHRFRALLSDEDWGRLPVAIWRRFSKRLGDGRTIVYVGEVDEATCSRIGWWFAQVARAIGGPLPISYETGVPTIVTMTENATAGGQIWTRIYARNGRFPQVIHSCKRFCGPTGLEEYVGRGISMALRVCVGNETLQFHSTEYSFGVGRLRLPLPDWLTPGHLIVSHADLGGGTFRFTLDLTHPRFGRLIHQSAVFTEAAS
jgi:Domain of unknown function (DUF4166)